MAEGVVFDIQRFSVNDGPGIRTTIFFKGCPLACRWCHNPEGRDRHIQIRYFPTKCLKCGACTKIVGFPPMKLAGKKAGTEEITAAQTCPSGALAISGMRYTSQQLIEIIERDKVFYGLQGGVTFSGGEPTVQPEFLEEMLLLCREHGIHTTLDTCGYSPKKVFEKLVPLTKLVLFDIKGINSETHRYYTGKDNDQILDNFQLVAELGAQIWVRIPLIKGLTVDGDALEKIADFLEPYKQVIQQVTLMPYHSFGNVKYETLGLTSEVFSEIKGETLYELKRLFSRRGFVVMD